MIRLLVVFMIALCLTGCTVDISKDKSSKIDENDSSVIDEENEKEKIDSIGVSSSLDKPLTVGQYGSASKYNAVLDEYKDVDVTITKIYDNPNEIVNEYNLNNPDSIIKKNEGYKFIVLDYEVIFYDFVTESFGTDVVLDMEVTNSSGNSFIVNDIKQVISIYIISKDVGIVDSGKGTVKVAFAIPNDVNDYLIKLGTHEHTIAYYKV